MAKLYSETSSDIDLNPKAETIKFLLNYSKALHVMHAKTDKIKIILN